MSPPGWPPLLELRQYILRPGRRDELIALFDAELRAELSRLAAGPVALFESAEVANTFPALPVREGESVLASVTRLDDAPASAAYSKRLGDGPRGLEAEPQRLRLAPTSRSRLR